MLPNISDENNNKINIKCLSLNLSQNYRYLRQFYTLFGDRFFIIITATNIPSQISEILVVSTCFT